jgi:hypothetical protein
MNQGCRRDIGQRNESEAGRKRVGSVVKETDQVRPSKSAELPDRIDESEGCGCRRFAQHGCWHRPENGKERIEEAAAQQQKYDR